MFGTIWFLAEEQMPMNYRKLGRTHFEISEIGMGTEHLLDKDEQIVIQTIKAAIDGGITYLD